MAISVLQKQEGFVSVGLLFLMTVVKTVSSINLLEMAEGPGMESNHVEIEAVQGGEARLPCDLVPSQPGDSVYLVLWYKKDDKTPIYSYDSRSSGAGGAPDLWSEPSVFGDRAKFIDYNGLQQSSGQPAQPAVLSISDVSKFHDEGEFTCRVDFRQSPTKYHRVRLAVIVPPQKPIIMDQTGNRIVGEALGPLDQGQTITLDCLVNGGDPLPRVYWYRNDQMIDDSDMKTFENTVKNRIVLSNIVRSDLNARYRCLAINNNLTAASESSLKINMLFPPLAVKISSEGRPFAAGNDYFVRCITWGSNPPATLTWARTNGRKYTNKHLKVVNETSHDNFTESVMLYHPKPSHHGHSLSCSAANENIVANNVIEDKIKLEIFFPPTVSLDIGKALNLNDLEEGDDVYFECSISANPPPYKVTWLHNGKEILQKPEMQIFVSNQSLVLQKVTRKQAGDYTCHASNVEGDAESDPVTLTIMYAPVCDEAQDVVYGVSENETVSVSCSVKSYPAADTFTWSFNNSLTSTLLPASSYISTPGHSMITYTPHSHMDFGTLLCWGTNMVGNQKTNQPCVFHIIPTGPPDTPKKCNIINQTSSTISISCTPGYNGGLIQRLHVELYTQTRICIANITGQMNLTDVDDEAFTSVDDEGREVFFTVSKLPSDEQFDIKYYASNHKGKSSVKHLKVQTLPLISGEKVMTNAGSQSYSEEIPTLVVIFVGSTVTVLILVTMLIIANTMKRRISVKTDFPQQGMQIKTFQPNSGSASSWGDVQQPLPNCDSQHQDKSPDIIKDTKGEVSKYNAIAITSNHSLSGVGAATTEIKTNFSKRLNGCSSLSRGSEIDTSCQISPPDGGFRDHVIRDDDNNGEHVEVHQDEFLSHSLPRGYPPQPDYAAHSGIHSMYDYSAYKSMSMSRRMPGPGLSGVDSDMVGPNTRMGLPLCDNINVNRSSLRTPLLEDDRESCV